MLIKRGLIRKSQPSAESSHVNGVLSNVAMAYWQNRSNFVFDKVFPIVPVDKQTDKYVVFTKNDWFRDEAKRRADASESAGSGYNLDTSNTYSADVWAMHKDIGEQARANSDSFANVDRSATEFVTQRLLLRQEIQWTADFFAASTWGTDVTPSVLWSTYASSDPIGDVETGKLTVLQNTGFLPNTLVLGYNVAIKLRNHPDLVDRFKYTSSSSITNEMMAQVLGVERVLTCMATKATNVEGETAAMALVQGKHALLCYTTNAPSTIEPSAGYTFSWRGISNGQGLDVGIEKFYMQKEKADRVEGQVAMDNKVTGSDLGYFFASVVA